MLMENWFEDLYGRLFRSYAKSIIEEIGKNAEGLENKNLLTVGILQYRSYDNVFHYAPTLKNVFVFPEDSIINGSFPTNNNDLWDYKLMVSLAKYFYSIREHGWIEDIFYENEQLENNNASIFASLFQYYNEFRSQWRDWFLTNVDKFYNITEKETSTLNQLFYFANYLISIAKWPAYINNNPDSYAENIYICVNIFKHACNVKSIFQSPSASLDKEGAHISWEKNPSTKHTKSSLLFVLEVCFKQPFNIDIKVKIIEDIIKDRYTNSKLYINAVAKPLYKAGEFLGIAYITWPSKDENTSKRLYPKITEIITEILKFSKISRLLYEERTSAAKFYLQKINSNQDIEKSTIQRIFDITHVFSSAHIVAYCEDDDFFIKFLMKKDNDHYGYKQYKHTKTKDDFFKFLMNTTGVSKVSLNNHVLWIDVAKKEIIKNQDCLEYYQEISSDITYFDNSVNEFICDKDLICGLFYQITNITIHSFYREQKEVFLVFFNSNFFQLFNYYQQSLKWNKQMQAFNMYHCINELIEDEYAYRTIFIKERDAYIEASREMERDFVHFAKSILMNTYDYVMNMKTSEIVKLSYYGKVIDSLVKKLTKYLTVFSSKYEKYTMSIPIKDVIECWNNKCDGYALNEKISLTKCEKKCDDRNFSGNVDAIDMIFEELIQNAIKVAKYNPTLITLSFDVKNDRERKDIVVFSVLNIGSSISEKKKNNLGRKLLSDSQEGGGFGYRIIESLLKGMGALEYKEKEYKGKEKNIHFEIRVDNENPSFEFNFKTLLI